MRATIVAAQTQVTNAATLTNERINLEPIGVGGVYPAKSAAAG